MPAADFHGDLSTTVSNDNSKLLRGVSSKLSRSESSTDGVNFMQIYANST